MEKPLNIVALIFPGMTQLDLTGPLEFISKIPGAHVTLAWREPTPITNDSGFAILPSTTFADAPQADVLLVPGGAGVFDFIEDADVIDFVRRQGTGARFVTSVCTGAFFLGAAGLLQGRRATTHWASHALLAHLGATPVAERVVVDGNVITGGGVTSGIDFGLRVVAEVGGEALARKVQLALEYDPQPPFDSGAARADDPAVQQLRAHYVETRGPRLARIGAALAGS
ncbi:DJ-1/PfpI family protein [Haematomicrobium sanguinis]|uniref:DJ-1/PfpI family protein n=1 Tax=Haematomicrobium sanguinis TaxID=479106 RepID=UPI00054E9048|nr:DJ-1/PfpI family protein [Haematomicrobium sanguinis]